MAKIEFLSTLNKDELKTVNQIVRLSPKYKTSGLSGYLHDILRALSSAKQPVITNPAAANEAQTEKIELAHTVPVFGQKVQTPYSLVIKNSQEAKWIKDLNDQLEQKSFWNLARIFDYFMIQTITQTSKSLTVPLDTNTLNVLRDMNDELSLRKMNNN